MTVTKIPSSGSGNTPNPYMVGIGVFLSVLIVAAASTSFYTVEPQEVGLVLRFGKYIETSGPGLHFKMPWGIDSITKVRQEEEKTEEFGYRTKSAGIKSESYSFRDAEFLPLARDPYRHKLGFKNNPFLTESLILTGDLNLAEVQWTVFYKIKDPVDYVFKVRNVIGAIRDLSESIIRRVVGDATVDEVITSGRGDLQSQAEELLQEALDQYGSGVQVQKIVFRAVVPPIEVKDAFNKVEEANQEKETIVNQAQANYNKIIPKAKGTAMKRISEAEGYALNRVNQANGDADKFLATWNEYKNAKEVTRKRMYLETMLEIYPNINKKIIIDSSASSVLPLLNLNSEEAKGGVL